MIQCLKAFTHCVAPLIENQYQATHLVTLSFALSTTPSLFLSVSSVFQTLITSCRFKAQFHLILSSTCCHCFECASPIFSYPQHTLSRLTHIFFLFVCYKFSILNNLPRAFHFHIRSHIVVRSHASAI